MNRPVRAGGIAAAVLGFTASLFMGEPLKAVEGEVAPAEFHYLNHADAGAAVSPLGLNAIDPEQPLGPEEVARFTASVTKVADAALPRPRALEELVVAYGRAETDNEEQDCLASAVYFEARGEPVLGQLAVADVVLNRVASEKYPDTICEVVEQPWQFSFVNATGKIPEANRHSQAWRTSVAIARAAQANAARKVDEDVLWYHADYVAPGWGKRLQRQVKVGLHIFYS